MLERLDTPVQRWVDVDIAQTSFRPSLRHSQQSQAIDWTQAPELEIAINVRMRPWEYATDLKTLDVLTFSRGSRINRRYHELSFPRRNSQLYARFLEPDDETMKRYDQSL